MVYNLEIFKKFNEFTKLDSQFTRDLKLDNSYKYETFVYRGVKFFKSVHGYYICKALNLSLKPYYKKITKKQYEYIKALKIKENQHETVEKSKKFTIPSLFPELD